MSGLCVRHSPLLDTDQRSSVQPEPGINSIINTLVTSGDQEPRIDSIQADEMKIIITNSIIFFKIRILKVSNICLV